MFARALFAFVALPGLVAYVVPPLLAGEAGAVALPRGIGLVPVALGTALLLWCVWIFYREGKGTLAPWDPPKRLVMSGPYRWSRNPMYVAVVLVLAGWALAYGTTVLAIYAAAVTLAFHLRIVFGEEPWLARTHGPDWVRYRTRVPRWFGLPN
jgi:protein-S-isoprenylcysteine O-methyltransferase Ste14